MKKEYTEETRMVHINMTNLGSRTLIGCINSGLVAIAPGESQARTVTEIIDNVKTEICDSYCKYADGVTKEDQDSMLEKHCKSCPLNKL
ncbi:MAG: hypothetical protein PUE58_01865 [Lachnospiraceae bacterium]|nr:hypothetical protein [Lachnospiraceae bacterium]